MPKFYGKQGFISKSFDKRVNLIYLIHELPRTGDRGR